MKDVMSIVGMVAVGVLTVILNGWVLSIIWGWFIVPVFAVSPLGTAQALGVTIAARLVTNTDKYVKKEPLGVPEAVFISIATPFMALGFSWIVLQFL